MARIAAVTGRGRGRGRVRSNHGPGNRSGNTPALPSSPVASTTPPNTDDSETSIDLEKLTLFSYLGDQKTLAASSMCKYSRALTAAFVLFFALQFMSGEALCSRKMCSSSTSIRKWKC